jgi:hypothetical protein
MSSLSGLKVPKPNQYCRVCHQNIKVVADPRAPGGLKYDEHYSKSMPKSTDELQLCSNSGRPVPFVSYDYY